jgi:hypothetical protein
LYGGYPTKVAGSTQNPKKVIGTPTLLIKTKIFLKILCLYLKSVNEPKLRMGAFQRNSQAQPKMLKKFVETSKQINQKQKFPKKKYV